MIHIEQIAKDQENKKIGKISLLFTCTVKGYEKTLIPSLDSLRQPAFVLSGVMQRPLEKMPNRQEATQKLLKRNVVDLVLMNSADHRQCLDPSRDEAVHRIGGPRFAAYKTDALKEGCALDNPSLFFINHAFCASIGHQDFLKRRFAIGSALDQRLPLRIMETIVEYEEEA